MITPSILEGSKKEEKVKLPGQEFTEQELVDLRNRGEDLRIKGPFEIFRIKRDFFSGKIMFDPEEKKDYIFLDCVDPFYEGYLHIGEDGKVELVLLNAFPPEWLDEIEQRRFADWVRGYVRGYYNSFLGDKDFPVTIECRGEATV